MKHSITIACTIAALCSSATAQGLGAAPQSYWQDVQTRAAIKGVRACWLVGLDAQRIVLRRYAGAGMSDAMGDAFWPEDRAMVREAYGMQRMASDTFQLQQQREFNDRWESRCFDVLGSDG